MICNQALSLCQFKYSLLDQLVLLGLQLWKFKQSCFCATFHGNILGLRSHKCVEHALSSFINDDHAVYVFAVGQIISSQRLGLNRKRQVLAVIHTPLNRTRRIDDLLEVDYVVLIDCFRLEALASVRQLEEVSEFVRAVWKSVVVFLDAVQIAGLRSWQLIFVSSGLSEINLHQIYYICFNA